MEIIESEKHRGQFNYIEGKAKANRCVLSCFLKVWIVEHDVTERVRNSNGGAGRSEPTRAEYSANMWNTKFMCTKRAESTRRTIRTNEERQIWRGYGMEWLKSQESNLEVLHVGFIYAPKRLELLLHLPNGFSFGLLCPPDPLSGFKVQRN